MRKTFKIIATYVQGHAVEQNVKNHNIYLTSSSILYIHSLHSRFINYAGEDEWESNYNRCIQYGLEIHNERSEYITDIYTHFQVWPYSRTGKR